MVVAILAAIVASQAIITATFQLLAQIVKLSYFPQIQVVHTSKTYHNQLYVPLVNYLLCIGSVAITAVSLTILPFECGPLTTVTGLPQHDIPRPSIRRLCHVRDLL
jgi:K+ transporter